MSDLFYLAKNNINKGIDVYRKPPIKLFRIRDANVCWSGSGGEDGEMIVCFYILERFISGLEQPPGSCMKVEVGSVDGVIFIKILDRDVDCKVNYS